MDTVKSTQTNYWTLTKQLENSMPSSLTAEIFTPNTINHFTGNKPETSLKINWHTYTPADSIDTWISDAWLTYNGNIRVVQGTTTPSGTTYQYNDVKNGGSSSAYNIAIERGVPVISLKNTSAEKINVDTATQHVAVYTDKNSVDANYLKAALKAIGGLTQQKTSIKSYSKAGAIPDNQDWVFWLSDQPAGPSIKQKTKNLFMYESGKVDDTASWLSDHGTYAVTQGQSKISLYKSIKNKEAVADALWTDGFGRPILTLKQYKANTYYFYTRFNPAWNDLVWSDEFPKWLLELTAFNRAKISNHERRVICSKQSQPVFIDSKSAASISQTRYTDLSHYIWLVLALIFLTERWLATKNERKLANG